MIRPPAVHWTYAACAPGSDLDQGDVLSPTPELRAILNGVHPHFCDAKYLGFLIATQSCDLVRRSGSRPTASYISIAVIRSLRQVLPRLLLQVADPVAAGVPIFPVSAKLEAKRFLTRLFDQNEQALGLFYLHEDAEIQLGEPSVAFLRVKVALRADHYDVLLDARRGHLNSEFRAKLGWLLGNLYSRAATTDWADVDGGRAKRDALVDKYLQDARTGAGPAWIEDDVLAAANAAGAPLTSGDIASLCAELAKHTPTPKVEQLADEAVAQALKVLQAVLNKSTTLQLTDPARAAIQTQFQTTLRNRLLNNGVLRKLAR